MSSKRIVQWIIEKNAYLDEKQIKFIFYLNNTKNPDTETDPFDLLEAARLCYLPDQISEFVFLTKTLFM